MIAETRGGPIAEHRIGRAGDPPELREHCPDLRRHPQPPPPDPPLGFDISEKAVRRAGLDYWPMVDLRVYDGLEQFFTEHPAPDLWLATTKAPRSYDQAQFRDGCYLFFGKETAGLPLGFREEHRERCIRIPMRPDARSLNLANSVAVVAYEALRQLGFPGLSGQGEMAEGL